MNYQLIDRQDAIIHRFCVSHTAPLLPETWYDDCIALGNYRVDSVLHVRHLDEFWHDARPVAYGAAGTHVIPIAVDRFVKSADLIEVSLSRKRVLPLQVGTPSAVPGMRELSPHAALEMAELAEFLPPSDSGFLLPQPIDLKQSTKRYYAVAHHRRDIIDYAALAIELGVLDKRSAREFLRSRILIPGGTEIGVFPRWWVLQTLPAIERISREFLIRYGERVKDYDKYQIRAVGFLSERLGSYLVLRHLATAYSGSIPSEVFGFITAVVEEGTTYAVGMADEG